MVVGVVQYAIEWENPQANFQKVDELLNRYPPPPGALIVLPEMFATGFSMSREVPRAYKECAAFLKSMAKRHGVFVGGGVAREFNDTLRNAYLVVSPNGDEVGEYHKSHPFSMGDEGRFYTGGQEVLTVTIDEARVAPTICYDLRFPELYRRATLWACAEVLVVAANWPEKRDSHWQTLLRARAIENQAYVVGVNRTGKDPYFSYCGSSCVVAPWGDTLLYSRDTEGIWYTALDVEKLRIYREKFPVLQDVKPWLFHGKLQT